MLWWRPSGGMVICYIIKYTYAPLKLPEKEPGKNTVVTSDDYLVCKLMKYKIVRVFKLPRDPRTFRDTRAVTSKQLPRWDLNQINQKVRKFLSVIFYDNHLQEDNSLYFTVVK
jgi:hypothetical protein